MKNLAKLNGAKALSRTEQKSINGGKLSRGCSGPLMCIHLDRGCIICIE